VLVAAPTGAGKTIIADYAVYLSQQTMTDKTFYTTPMKALSNQKFQDLQTIYGIDEVGLLTGDTSINPTARIVIMTTEVLRNMLYAQSDLLKDLRFVVMDEVHYLADKFRGPVWEEVILHLPQDVSILSLSATVSNAEEFGEWLGEVRGDTRIVVEEHRPRPGHPAFQGGSTEFPLGFPHSRSPPGGCRQAVMLFLIGLSGAGNRSWNPGNLSGKPSFRSEDTVKNSRGTRGVGLAPPAADRIGPFFDDRAVRPPLSMRLPP
jgi:hypothetical protein